MTRPVPARVIRLCLVVGLVTGACCGGCARQRVNEQLGSVAKEWSRTIRASQVIPIYPLSEDVAVGDCFVVQVPSEDEVELWDRSGFLPLTHHFKRLNLNDTFDDFYAEDFNVTNAAPHPPRLWRRPPDEPVSLAEVLWRVWPYSALKPWLPMPSPARHLRPTQWDQAPRASFPSFTIKVSTQAAGSLSLPVQGIPFGLSALNAQDAVTSVTLSDAYTYGMDVDAVHQKLTCELGKAENKERLRKYEPRRVWDPDLHTYRVDYSYVRVVHRVYLVGSVDVSVTDTTKTDTTFALFKIVDDKTDKNGGSTAGEGETGSGADAKPPATQEAKPKPEVQQLNAALKVAFDRAAAGQFGGDLTVTDKTDRAISLRQSFDRPLVVGYISFDVPIGPGGELGSTIVATQVRLRRGPLTSVSQWAALSPDATSRLEEWLDVDGNRQWLSACDHQVAAGRSGAEDLRKKLAKPFVSRSFTIALARVMDAIPALGREEDDQYRQVAARILHEVVRKPDGIGYMPAIGGLVAARNEDSTPEPAQMVPVEEDQSSSIDSTGCGDVFRE